MKILHIILILGLALNTSCNNDDDQVQNPIDRLPPATQTGEQTFGCLINGEVFLPDNFGRGRPNAFYQFVDGAFTFVIAASSGGGPELLSISIGGLDIAPLKSYEYSLEEEKSGNTYGGIVRGLNYFTTEDEKPGKLTITNFDPENFIISGTFEFTAFDDEGNEIKITDGRFDMHYTN